MMNMIQKWMYLTTVVLLLLGVSSCATYTSQISGNQDDYPDKNIEHSFYLIGDAGNSPLGEKAVALEFFEEALNKAPEKSTVLFLGDNIYPDGLPKKEDPERAFAEHQLNIQTEITKNFKGKTIFIPGNHDWYSEGLKGLKRQENYVEKILGKNSFLPENGCPIDKVDISENIALIIIDSEWYLANWDKHPSINDDCEIKTRNKFFDELEGLIKKARGKTTVIAIHHPMFTNGPHGGYYSFKSHLTPLPILGTLKNTIRKTSGISPADLQHKRYNELKKRLVTIAQENKKVILVSGHEHNLQYLIQDNLHQIISGSGSKLNPAKNVKPALYTQGTPGFARLDIFNDGSSHLQFYDAKERKLTYEKNIFSAVNNEIDEKLPSTVEQFKNAGIYSVEETDKSGLYTFFWGDRYRKYYSSNIKAKTVLLDTLLGGLKPIRKGGGHQSMSLRLEDYKGSEYVMRALRKNALQYLQAVAFKDQYIEGKFDNTATELLLLDVFTGAHPYAPFTIGTLASAINIYHTNPKLYYVPKQQALGKFNDEFGDALYMIEERAADGHGDKKSFGYSNEVISTDDLLKNLKKDEKYLVDENTYVRARIFDMLIGDWDRHEDQWRWAEFKMGKEFIYKPIPRDRDQAFSIMSDGALLGLLTKIVPGLRLMKSYDTELKSPKWFNLEPYPLDIALLKHANRTTWIDEAEFIQKMLTKKIIDDAFENIPEELNDETVSEIKRKLKGRKANIQKIAEKYYEHLNKFAVIRGTNKDDLFEVIRGKNGRTQVIGYRITNGEKGAVFHDRTYAKKDTKEIWIYALDDTDVFNVYGNGDNHIKLRLIGGQNEDLYNIENGKRTFIYDYRSKKNEFSGNKGKFRLRDHYETNVYDYKKLKNSSNQFFPTIGANPDDGLKFGLSNTTTNFGFERNPFTWQQKISAAIYTETEGIELNYSTTFANLFPKWNLELAATYTSPNYSMNFFDFGNSSENLNYQNEDLFDMDYNRVKIQQISFAPSIVYKGNLNSMFKLGIKFNSIEVDQTDGRFIKTYYSTNNKETEIQYLSLDGHYQYSNTDNEAFPTLGFKFDLRSGYKNNMNESNGFGYIIPSLEVVQKINNSGQLVIASTIHGHFNLGDNFEFYDAANIGANNGLRGYRNQRFAGKSAFYHSSDIRWNLSNIRTGLMPLSIGIFGGFDYGRVWTPDHLMPSGTIENDRWNNSAGLGIFANASDMMSLHVSIFNGNEGNRFSFGFGFGF